MKNLFLTGPYKTRNGTKTKQNETQRNETQRNETKRNATKQNATERNETQRNEIEIKRNGAKSAKYHESITIEQHHILMQKED